MSLGTHLGAHTAGRRGRRCGPDPPAKQNRARGMPSSLSETSEMAKVVIKEIKQTKTNRNEVRVKLPLKRKRSGYLVRDSDSPWRCWNRKLF